MLNGEGLQNIASAPAFLDVSTNPTETGVQEALAVYRAHDCGGVVAIRGGSVIELAKGSGVSGAPPLMVRIAEH